MVIPGSYLTGNIIPSAHARLLEIYFFHPLFDYAPDQYRRLYAAVLIGVQTILVEIESLEAANISNIYVHCAAYSLQHVHSDMLIFLERMECPGTDASNDTQIFRL